MSDERSDSWPRPGAMIYRMKTDPTIQLLLADENSLLTANIVNADDSELAHMRAVLASALTIIENVMDDRGAFTRYTKREA